MEATLIKRKEHREYIICFSIAVWFALSLFAACLFPHCFAYRRSSAHFFGMNSVFTHWSLLWFLPVGIVLGFFIGLAFDRFIIVKNSAYDSTEVPLSKPARWGKILLSWRGLVFLAAVIGLYFLGTFLRPFWYRANILGWYPGLSFYQPFPVRNMAIAHLYHKKYRKLPPSAVKALCKTATEDPELEMRRNAIFLLRLIGDSRSVDALISVLEKDPDIYMRGNAASDLRYIGNRKAIPALLKALKDPNNHTYVRGQAARALAMLKESNATKPLLNILKNETDNDLRVSAAFALGKLGEASAAEDIIGAYDNATELRVQEDYIRILGEFNDMRTIRTLLKATAARERVLRDAAKEALWKILGRLLNVKGDNISAFIHVKGMNPNARDEYGNTHLHWAVQNSYRENAAIVTVDWRKSGSKEKAGSKFSGLSAIKGPENIIKFLLDNGADPNLKNNNHKTPLDYAIYKNGKKIAALLRAHGGKTGKELEKETDRKK